MAQISSITARLASKNPEKMGELIPLIIKKLLIQDENDKGEPIQALRNRTDAFTNFNVKILKELVFFCQDSVKANMDDILLIIKLL